MWGITIGNTIFQNELAKKLPESFIQFVPEGIAMSLLRDPSCFCGQSRGVVESPWLLLVAEDS